MLVENQFLKKGKLQRSEINIPSEE